MDHKELSMRIACPLDGMTITHAFPPLIHFSADRIGDRIGDRRKSSSRFTWNTRSIA